MLTPNYYMKAPEFVPNCLDIVAAYGQVMTILKVYWIMKISSIHI